MRIGFIGLGNMGGGMAANLARAGWQPVVRDVRPGVAEAVVELGGSEASSNEEVGGRSDVVFIAVFDDKQVLEVCLGSDEDAGVVSGMAAGGVVVIHSTISPATLRALNERAQASGVSVLDAAMTGGGHVAANEGSLTFFVGGNGETLEKIRPMLEAMATHIFPVGNLGAGMLTKVISNFLAISNVGLVREALRLTKAYGIDEQTILSMVQTGGVGASWVSNNWAAIRAQEESYTTAGGMVAMAGKDLNIAFELATERGADMPLLDYIRQNVIPDLGTTGMTG
jgi:3-hydroxyisobutyrate dehydrogenase-like beta-hydroxyacid dehydrogenase